METFAYLHHASEYETTSESLVQETWKAHDLQGLPHRNRTNLSRMHYLLSLALISFMVLGLDGNAWALQYGDEGAEVMALQTKLREQGYLDVEPSGLYRGLTEEAVVQFQQDRGLQVDGIAGDETRAALRLNEFVLNPVLASEGSDSLPNRRLSSAPSQILANVPPFNPMEQNLVVNLQPTVSASVFLRSKDFDYSQYSLQDCFKTFEETIASNNVISSKIKGKRVLCLQNTLIKLGYLDLPNNDSTYNPSTKEAVMEFQRNKGIDADGEAGFNTLRELVRDAYYSKERVANLDYFGFFW